MPIIGGEGEKTDTSDVFNGKLDNMGSFELSTFMFDSHTMM